MADMPGGTPATAPRWMRITLVVSLALNLLILSLVASTIFFKDRPDRHIARDVAAAPFVMALTKDDRAAMFQQFREDRPGSLRDNRKLLRDRFEALLAALRSETFDRSAVAQIMSEQKDAATARQAVGERLLLDRLESMTSDERAAYADRLEKSLRRGPKH